MTHPLKLFISYRSSDAVQVDKIARDLALLRYDDGTPRYLPWQDKHNLPPASPNWWDAIVNAIIECPVFVFHLSRASLQSEVCLAELDYAHKRNRPIIPVVLEFDLDPKSAKYTIDYWELVPEWLKNSQFLFYTGAEFFIKFQQATSLFERAWPRDIPAPRPLSPDGKSLHGSNHALYDAACDYAERLVFVEAEKYFDLLVRRNDADYADAAAQWIELIRLYAELIEIDQRRSATFLFKKRWSQYTALYPKEFLEGIFDPRKFAGREATPTLSRESKGEVKVTPSAPQKPASTPTAEAIRQIIGEPFEWCEVPAGQFLYGEDKKPLELPKFYIAKYPITYAQFQTFIDAEDGFYDLRWWQGLAADDNHRRQPDDQRWKIATHPRDNVSWYDAMAFCRWLSSKLGGESALEKVLEWKICLPTEQEWEKAARGTDGRIYPWGDEYKAGYANIDERRLVVGGKYLGQTTPVGSYPQGASPYGVLDMCGNVWEWCLNKYGNPASTGLGGDAPRVVRGGSWYYARNPARAAYRDLISPPNSRNNLRGFRVCGSAPLYR